MIQAMLTMVLVLGAALAQSWAGPVRLLGEVRAPVLLGATIFFALNREFAAGLALAFVCGLLQDLLSMTPLGFATALFCVTAVVVSRFKGLVLAESAATGVFFGGVATALVWLTLGLLLAHEGLLTLDAGSLALKVVGAALLGAVSTPLFFVMAAAAYRAIALDERKEEPRAIH
jgi:rod shape-determining protein MreD